MKEEQKAEKVQLIVGKTAGEQKDMNEDKTEVIMKEDSPKNFRIEGTGREEHDTQVMMAEISNYAVYLQSGDEFKNHLTLLYLMCRENLDKDFIRKIFSNGSEMDIVSLDLLHCAAIVAGEDFALGLLGQEITIEDFQDTIADQSALRKFQAFETIQEITDETMRARDAYNIHIEYLKQSRDEIKEHYEGLLEEREKHYQENIQLKEEMHEKDLNALTEKHQTEVGLLNANFENLSSELSAAQKELDKLHIALEEQKEAAASAVRDRDKAVCEYEQYRANVSSANIIDSASGKRNRRRQGKGVRGFICSHFSHRKEEERNKDFVLTLISNPQFSAEQLTVISDALNQKLPPENLAKICDPKIPVRNMKMMLAYMQRSDKESASMQDKKEESHHAVTKENS